MNFGNVNFKRLPSQLPPIIPLNYPLTGLNLLPPTYSMDKFLIRTASSAALATQQSQRRRPLLVVLVGLPGSGKSTLCATLTSLLPPATLRVVCQDNLKTRAKCERIAKSTLSRSTSVIVDRTNVTESQRRHWYNIAEELKVRVCVVHFQLPEEDLVRRVDSRHDHPTVKAGEGRRIVNLVKRGMTPPDPGESPSVARILRVSRDEEQEDIVAFVLNWISESGGGAKRGVGKGEEEGEVTIPPSPLNAGKGGDEGNEEEKIEETIQASPPKKARGGSDEYAKSSMQNPT